MMDAVEKFKQDSAEEILRQGKDPEISKLTFEWMSKPELMKYTYHFSWLGRPVIQYPQDLMALQEIIWNTKPDLIIETGIAHGGSLIFHASCLELNALCGGPINAHVVGIDIDIREHNRLAILEHPLYQRGRITMLEGSSVDSSIISRIWEFASNYDRIMVILDSNHTEKHVLDELNAYAKLVSKGCYCIIFDTIIEMMPPDAYPHRPWSRGNNPATAVKKFLSTTNDFIVDSEIDNKLLISNAPGGYLKRIKS